MKTDQFEKLSYTMSDSQLGCRATNSNPCNQGAGMSTAPATATMYANCMEEVKRRTGIVSAIASGQLQVPGSDDYPIELACVQLRKSLELIAFASVTTNSEKYSAAYADFAQHWNAKRLLKNLAKLHPAFYPVPVKDLGMKDGSRHVEPIKDGYLTQEDFILLYDRSSEVMHARNPFRTDSAIIDFKHSFGDWVKRIQTLLNIHYVQPVDSKSIWLVIMTDPSDGNPHVFIADRK